MTEYVFHVSGIHCPACKMLIEDILGEQADVDRVAVDLRRRQVTVESERGGESGALAERWSAALRPHGYRLQTEKPPADPALFVYALLAGVAILGLFFALQRSGLIDLGLRGAFTPSTAFFVGIVASLSTCLAVVGGLVLSLSASVAQDVNTLRPFFYFHSGRLIGFAALGGILGLAGRVIAPGPAGMAFLGMAAALVMIVLGFNLLGIIHAPMQAKAARPHRLLRRVTQMENSFLAPFLVGVGTFFLPCGFTQSMQFAALSSGSSLTGSAIMTFFALGTLPMLAALSFGSWRFAHSRFAPLFFKTSGVVVIGLGLFSLLAGFAALGIIAPIGIR